MLDDLKEEAIVNKVGGRFKLSTLIQKRMVALNIGAKPLVQIPGGDRLSTVIQEILQDKIFLDLNGEVRTRNTTASEAVRSVLNNQLGAYPAPAAIHTVPAVADDDPDE
jgi:DNA-directed RNA polymerase subunit omega